MRIHPEIVSDFVDALALSGNQQTASRMIQEISAAETQAYMRGVSVATPAELLAETGRLIEREERLISELKSLLRAARPNRLRIKTKQVEAQELMLRLRELQRCMA